MGDAVVSTDNHVKVFDLDSQVEVLNLVPVPVWFYDHTTCCNVWGNSAALELFDRSFAEFLEPQVPAVPSGAGYGASTDKTWEKTQEQLQDTGKRTKRRLSLVVSANSPAPGFLPFANPALVAQASYKAVQLRVDGEIRPVYMIQVDSRISAHDKRMVEMCDSHPMFQFLFDSSGSLLAANSRGIQNLNEHLAGRELTLQNYLAIGQCDGKSADEVYLEATDAIFVAKEPCYRVPQLRWSKRVAGKYRWVLHEMWPMTDPVSGQAAVLVTEQNISQVKAVEEQFKRQAERLEAQLQGALSLSPRGSIDIDTPAEKAVRLLDKIAHGLPVGSREAAELRDLIARSSNMSQPVNLDQQLLGNNSHSSIDTEVGESLLQLLTTKRVGKRSDTGSKERNERSPAAISPRAKSEQLPLTLLSSCSITQEAAKEMLALYNSLPDPLMQALATADQWQFDAFYVDQLSQGRPLSLLAYHLISRSGLVARLQLDAQRLVRFLMRIEDGYPSNPYHNKIHAADVLQTVHMVCTRGGLLELGALDDLSLLSCYLAAVVHDFQHKGVNNDYLVRVGDTLAILYNDRSPMENHHLAASFAVLGQDDYNFAEKLPHKAREQLRKLVVDMVLATDMKQHFSIHGSFQTKIAASNGPSRSGRLISRISSNQSDCSNCSEEPCMDEDTRSLVLQVSLKCADLGHLASPRPVHRKWVHYLEEEFFRQGDREKSNGLSVSPLMDREKAGMTKSQVGFFDIVALPLFQSLAQVFSGTAPLLEAVRDNYSMWRDEQQQAAHSSNSSNGSTRGGRSSLEQRSSAAGDGDK